MNQVEPLGSSGNLPGSVRAAGARASTSLLEFFASHIRNANTHRATAIGIATPIGNHSVRATGITAYPKNGGTLERAAAMANHNSTRTTQPYDRRPDELTLDEVERVLI